MRDTRDQKAKERDAYLTELLTEFRRGVYFEEQRSPDRWNTYRDAGCEPRQGWNYAGAYLSPGGDTLFGARDKAYGTRGPGGVWAPSLLLDQAMYLLEAARPGTWLSEFASISFQGWDRKGGRYTVTIVGQQEVIIRESLAEAICVALQSYLTRQGKWQDPTWNPKHRKHPHGYKRIPEYVNTET